MPDLRKRIRPTNAFKIRCVLLLSYCKQSLAFEANGPQMPSGASLMEPSLHDSLFLLVRVAEHEVRGLFMEICSYD